MESSRSPKLSCQLRLVGNGVLAMSAEHTGISEPRFPDVAANPHHPCNPTLSSPAGTATASRTKQSDSQLQKLALKSAGSSHRTLNKSADTSRVNLRHQDYLAPHNITTMATSEKPSKKERDPSKVHKLSLKGSARLVAEFVRLILSPPVPVEGASQPVAAHCAQAQKSHAWDQLTDSRVAAHSSNTQSIPSSTSAASTRLRTSPSSRSTASTCWSLPTTR